MIGVILNLVKIDELDIYNDEYNSFELMARHNFDVNHKNTNEYTTLM